MKYNKLYAVSATVRDFSGRKVLQIEVSKDANATSGTRITSPFDNGKGKLILDTLELTAEDVATLDDGKKLDMDEPVYLGPGFSFSEEVPAMLHRFTPDGGEPVEVVVDSVNGIIFESDNSSIETKIRSKMRYRLNAVVEPDSDGNRVSDGWYLPKRKKLLGNLAEYFVSAFGASLDELTAIVDEADSAEAE